MASSQAADRDCDPVYSETRKLRTWLLAAFAVLLSAASAFSYLMHVGQGIVIGGLIGLPGRESDIAFSQHWAAVWRLLTGVCLGGSIAITTVALPVFEDASPAPRFVARLILASIFSVALTAIIGIAAIFIVSAVHHAR